MKERLDRNRNRQTFFKEGEVWWCNFGENIGHEINGKGNTFTRPVYIFKKYDKYSFLGLPLTTKEKEGTWYVSIPVLGIPRTLILSQGRTLDYRRLDKKITELDDSVRNNVQSAYATLHITLIRAIAGAGRG